MKKLRRVLLPTLRIVQLDGTTVHFAIEGEHVLLNHGCCDAFGVPTVELADLMRSESFARIDLQIGDGGVAIARCDECTALHFARWRPGHCCAFTVAARTLAHFTGTLLAGATAAN